MYPQTKPQTAREAGLIQCRTCAGLSHPPTVLGKHEVMHCPRCGAKLRLHEHNNSIEVTWALLIASALLYIPANTLPVMSYYSLGAGQPDTILSGVFRLLGSGQWPLALIVFAASIVVPLMKLITLTFLLISIQRKSHWRQLDRMRLYKITEHVGRWSMVDVFVIAILTGLVQFGNMARVEANSGSFSFAAVVVLTMFAAKTLDGHLIWDITRQEERDK